MKLKLPCVLCTYEPEHDLRRMPFFDATLDEQGCVHITCHREHKTVVLLEAPRHHVLLYSAAMASIGGFANEAISVLNTALERAYEHYIRVIFRVKGADITEAWKQIAAQSERQVGAFIFLYTLVEGKAPAHAGKIAEIRNRIVHGGSIATDDTAAHFGELVFQRIQLIETALRKRPKHESAAVRALMDSQAASLLPATPDAHIKWSAVNVQGSKAIGGVETFKDYVGSLRQAQAHGMA